MTVSLLVVTPHPSFADHIRQGVEQAGAYRVHVAKSKAEAVVRAHDEACSLAFLDMDLDAALVAEVGAALRTVVPEIGLVVVAGEENPPALDEIRPWVLLRRPFDLSQLARTLGETAPEAAEPASSPDETPAPLSAADLTWLQDVSKAAQHLTRLTLESSAQAALIARNNDLWAYAGQLSQNAARELAQTVARHWDDQKGGDLLRFVRLETTRAEHMLYATRLAEGVILALVFDAETPFGTIRSQASHLADSLALGKTETEMPPKTPPLPSAAQEPLEEDDELEIPSIADILSDVPPPTPQVEAGVPQMNLEATSPQDETDDLEEIESSRAGPHAAPPPAPRYSRESSPVVPLKDLLLTDPSADLDATALSHTVEELDVTAPSKARRAATPVRRPAPGELDETRPHSVTEVAGRIILEPVSPGLYHLTYACLLVPRFSSHYLTGDLADRLGEWLPQICVAFGWRLEFLAVRPEYLQWVVNVPPATSPGYLMRIMRQQTSEKIFTEFKRYKRENPSGDFWAPGYLIMGGTQPHPPQLVKDYIKQTRQRQGASRPRK